MWHLQTKLICVKNLKNKYIPMKKHIFLVFDKWVFWHQNNFLKNLTFFSQWMSFFIIVLKNMSLVVVYTNYGSISTILYPSLKYADPVFEKYLAGK